MTKLQLEQRFALAPVETRAEAENTITGRPIVYASPTDIGGWFREVIAPGALDGADLSDVRLCLNHDTGYVYARARKGANSNTMEIEPNEYGLDFSATLSDAPAARDLFAAVSRGDISGMSFMFTVKEDSWADLDTDYPTRTIKQIGTVIEISAVTFPAYEATTINARDGKEALENARQAVETARSQEHAPAEAGDTKADELELAKAKARLHFTL